MCQTGHGRIELYDAAFGTMVALFTTAVMRMCGMCGSTMRAVVFQRSTTTCSCHHYSGNHTKQISQTAMSHYHLCCLVMHLFTLLLQYALAATASACITACTSAGATVTLLLANVRPQPYGCTGNDQYGKNLLYHCYNISCTSQAISQATTSELITENVAHFQPTSLRKVDTVATHGKYNRMNTRNAYAVPADNAMVERS